MLNLTRKGGHKAKGTRSVNKSKHKSKRKARSDELFRREIGVFKRVAKAVNSPYARNALEMLDKKDWLGLANAPFPDTEADTFPDDYLVQQMIRKNPRLPIAVDREAAALEKWKEAERACGITNALLEQCTSDFTRKNSACLAVRPELLAKLRKTIKEILGPLDRWALESIESGTRFGPGATFHCSGRNLTPNKRLEAEVGLTPRLLSMAGVLIPPGWWSTTRGLAITRGSRACTVPKDALVDRFIAIEPALNMRWQLGVGKYIRRRLKRIGLDLDHQADVNRGLVRSAQALKKATIDLASASDSVALQLIRFLFPADWCHLLELFRSPEMLVGSDWVTLEKISSMGNGFTFELETLLFYSVASLFDNDPAVFGDDIIVNQSCASDVIRTLNVLGFSVNAKKTFLAGSFFESCGVDVWRGLDVRPFYLKKGDDENDTTSSIIRMANAIRRYANRRCGGYGCDSRFLPAWLYALAGDRDAKSTFIPDGMGDDGVVRNFDECTPKMLRDGLQGFKGRVWSARPVTVNVTETLAGMMAALDTPPNQGDAESPRFGILFRRRGTLLEVQSEATLISYNYRKVAASKTGPWAVPFGGYGHNYTGGPDASQTFQSVRGRLGRRQLQALPCFKWQDLGPWL